MPKLRDALTEAHRTRVESSPKDKAAYLQDVLGQRLVAHIVGVSDARTVGRWAKGETEPRPEAEQKLSDAYHIFRLLLTQESPHTVRAWFVGLNPQLDDESPAEAILAGRSRDVLVAAKAFLAGG